MELTNVFKIFGCCTRSSFLWITYCFIAVYFVVLFKPTITKIVLFLSVLLYSYKHIGYRITFPKTVLSYFIIYVMARQFVIDIIYTIHLVSTTFCVDVISVASLVSSPRYLFVLWMIQFQIPRVDDMTANSFVQHKKLLRIES